MFTLVIAAVVLAPSAESAASSLTPPTAKATVEAFHAALGAGNRDLALSYLDPRVVIFEQGGAEMSREDYAAEHLEADIGFLKAVQVRVLDVRESVSGATAWVMTRTETTGTFEGKPVASRGAETMLLQRTGERWTIAHIHWSSQKMPR